MIRIEKTATIIENGNLKVAPGVNLYVVEQGDVTRTINPNNVQATETLVNVYNANEVLQTQPISSNSEGKYPYYVLVGGTYDLYVPSDTTNPIQPWNPIGFPYIKGTVFHNTNANMARPSGFVSIEWIGTVFPNNAEDHDTLLLI